MLHLDLADPLPGDLQALQLLETLSGGLVGLELESKGGQGVIDIDNADACGLAPAQLFDQEATGIEDSLVE